MVFEKKKEFKRNLCKFLRYNEFQFNILELNQEIISILDIMGDEISTNHGTFKIRASNDISLSNGIFINPDFAKRIKISPEDYLEILQIDKSFHLVPILSRNLPNHFFKNAGSVFPNVIILSSHAEFEPYTREIATGIHKRLEKCGIPSLRIEIRKQFIEFNQDIDVTISRYEVDITRKQDAPETIAKKTVNKNFSYRVLAKIYFKILSDYLTLPQNIIVVDIHGIAKMSPYGFESPLLIIGDASSKNSLIETFTSTIRESYTALEVNPRIVYRSPWGVVEHSLQLVKKSGNIPIIIEIRRDLRENPTVRNHLISSISEAIKTLIQRLHPNKTDMITYRVFTEEDLEQIHSIYLQGYSDLYGDKVRAHADQFLKLFQEALAVEAEGEMFIAERNGTPIGFATIHQEATEEWKFGPLVVIPPIQRQGIGSHLLQLCINFARSKKGYQIYLKVHEHNKNSIMLYGKFGFITTDTLPSDLEGIKYLKMILNFQSNNKVLK